MSRNIGAGARSRHGLVVIGGALAVLAAGLVGLPVPAAGSPGAVELVSVSAAGEPAAADTFESSLSADGGVVAYASPADNLVPGDTNVRRDVFVRDRAAGTTTRVSVSSAGEQAAGNSDQPVVSADGRFVAFRSDAANLVADDTNNMTDVFVHDRQGGTTSRASVTTDEAQTSGSSAFPDLSDNGRFVVFQSSGSNLAGGVAGAVYRRDLVDGTTMLVSVDQTGAPARVTSAPAVSGDGKVVAFASFDSDVVPGDTNAASDVFVRDLDAATTTRVSVDSAGTQGNANSGGTGEPPAISGDGRFVAFASNAGDLVGADTNARTDIFLRDRQGGVTTRVSVSSAGTEGDGTSDAPALSADGNRVAFESASSNLVASDANAGSVDVFVRDVPAGRTTVESVEASGVNRAGEFPDISADGNFVVFSSGAPNIVPGFLSQNNIFIHELASVEDPTTTSSTSTSTSTTSTTSTSPTSTTSTSSTSTSSTSTTLPAGGATCDGREPTVIGAGAVLGTPGADVILGSEEDDFILGGGGDDVVCGGGGDDTVNGRAGNDRLFGGDGDDRLIGAAGDELLDGGAGDDEASGDAGDDELRGGAGRDQLRGGAGNDRSAGGDGDDRITDGAGNDILGGDAGNDVLRGGPGNDDLSGGEGDDRLLGEPGDDTLDGDGGDDRCDGGGGTNSLSDCGLAQG